MSDYRLRACLKSFYVRIFEHNFAEDKTKIRRHTVVWQGFLTQSSAKFAEKDVHNKNFKQALRPHHGLCIAFFRGNGYSPAFTANMTDIIARLDSEDPLVTITDETDMICGSCPHNSGGKCVSEEKVADFDKAVLDACGLGFHGNIRWRIFRELVRQNIIIPGKRNLICGDCQWNDLCTVIENEK